MGIADVARSAGVSPTTVSHVFSGRRHVAAETRIRVLAAADALNYVADSNARALATGKRMTIVVALMARPGRDQFGPQWLRVLEGVSAAASRAGYSVLVLPSGEIEERLRDRKRAPGFDGAIVVSPFADDALMSVLTGQAVDVVTIDRFRGPIAVPSVVLAEAEGLRLLMSHLNGEGVARPVMFAEETAEDWAADLVHEFRRSGVGAGESPRVVVPCTSVFDVYRTTQQLARQGNDGPDAVVVMSDSHAEAVVDALHMEGATGRIRVVSLADGPKCERLAVTAVTFPARDVGAAAAQSLIDLIAGGTVAEVTYRPTLAIRGSIH